MPAGRIESNGAGLIPAGSPDTRIPRSLETGIPNPQNSKKCSASSDSSRCWFAERARILHNNCCHTPLFPFPSSCNPLWRLEHNWFKCLRTCSEQQDPLTPYCRPLVAVGGNSKVLLQQKFCLTLLRFYFLCDIKNAFSPVAPLHVSRVTFGALTHIINIYNIK